MRKIVSKDFYRRHKIIFVHVLCWALFVAYEQSIVLFSRSTNNLLTNLYYYAVNIILFYSHYYLLGRTVGGAERRYLTLVLLIIPELIFCQALKFAGMFIFYEYARYSAKEIWTITLLDVYRSIFFLGMSSLIWSALNLKSFRNRALQADQYRLVAERDKALLEAKVIEVQNAYYQHQFNPHLLLNMLSFIYNRVYEHSEPASRSVLLLAEVLRFSLDEGDTEGKVRLAAELQQVLNLLEINRLRYDDMLYVEFTQSGSYGNHTIIPLILLTLTENLFKHGVVNDADNPARLTASINEGGLLTYSCRNAKRQRSLDSPSTNLGLRNVRIRLDQAYPGNYHLQVEENKDTYHLILSVKL